MSWATLTFVIFARVLEFTVVDVWFSIGGMLEALE